MHICQFIQKKHFEIGLNVAKSFACYNAHCPGEGDTRLPYGHWCQAVLALMLLSRFETCVEKKKCSSLDSAGEGSSSENSKEKTQETKLSTQCKKQS